MKNKRKIILPFLIFLLAVPAFAVTDINFDQALEIDQIQYYWSSDSDKGANYNGRIINPDPSIIFNLDDADYQAKAGSTPPTDIYWFGAEDDYTGSQTIYLRVWENERQVKGNKYTANNEYDNPYGSPMTYNVSVNYAYIYADPEKAELYQVDETFSKAIPAGTTTGKLKVYSQQQGRDDGLEVEVGSREWYVEYNGSDLNITSTSANLELTTANGYVFNTGDEYAFKVRYQNLWGDWGEWSDVYTHVVAGAGAVTESIALTLHKVADGYGVNDVIIPYSTTYISGVRITDLQALKTQIEAAGTTITAIGIWDESSMTLKGATFENGSPTYTSGISSLSDVSLSAGDAVQVSVDREVSITLTSQ